MPTTSQHQPAVSNQAGHAVVRAISSIPAMLCAALLTLISLYPKVYNDKSQLREPFDMSIYYGAIKHWLASGTIYDWTYPPEHIYGFTYPPFAAIFFSPIAIFPSEKVLSPFFLLANVAAMVLVTFISLRALGTKTRLSWAISLWLAPLLMLTFPIHQNMWMGQINMFLILLILTDLVVLKNTRFHGILTALAASIKMTPAIFGLYFIAKRDWTSLVRFIATGIAAIVFSFIIDFKVSLEFFTDKIFEANRVGSIVEPLSFNILGETSRLFTQPFNSILYAVLAIALTVISYLSARTLLTQGKVLYAVTVIGFLMLMVSPISWNHHWVWMIPALIICAVEGWRQAHSGYLFLVVSGAVLFTQRFEAWFSGNHWDIGQWPLYAVLMHVLPAVWTCAFIVLPTHRISPEHTNSLISEEK